MKKSILLTLLIITITGCADNQPNNENEELIGRLNRLEIKTDAQSKRSIEMTIKLSKLQKKVDELSFHSSPTYRIVSPASIGSGYMTMKSITGGNEFFLAVSEITKYADGYKVIFQIGNPNSVIYTGVDLTVMWGKFEESSESVKEKKIRITKDILPGIWNQVSFIISPANEDEISQLGVIIDTESAVIRLQPDPRI